MRQLVGVEARQIERIDTLEARVATLDSAKEKTLEDQCSCPLTLEPMADPVTAADGHTYERSAIERWLATKSTSPMTGEALVHSFVAPNHTLRRQIREWEEANAC